MKIPTTVEGMGIELKNVCDDYISDKINTKELETNLKYLKSKRQDLFIASLTVRWVGIKRLKLINSVLDQEIQTDI